MVLGSPTSTGKAGGAREMHWRILPRCETITVKNSPEVCVAKHNLHEHSLGIPGTPHHPPHTNCSSSPTLRTAGGSETLQGSLLCSLQPRNLPDFGERRKVWQEGQSSSPAPPAAPQVSPSTSCLASATAYPGGIPKTGEVTQISALPPKPAQLLHLLCSL